MTMVRCDLDPQQALVLLSARALTHGKTASATALDVIAGKATFDE
ncbi:hypothetical protein ACFTUC_29270 [Streptomyces sp. NPDC056944]